MAKKRAKTKSRPAKRKTKKSRIAGMIVLLLIAAAAGILWLNRRMDRELPKMPMPKNPFRRQTPKPPAPKPKPRSRVSGASEKGARLLLATKNELESNRALFRSGLGFSDCSAAEGLSCLVTITGSDEDFILVKKSIEGLWDEQGVSLRSNGVSGNSEIMTAMQAGSRLAQVELRIRPMPGETPGPRDPARAKKKIAIVIDDVGEDYQSALELARILEPITLSILPSRAYSQEALKLGKEFHKQVMLHMPMQPEDYPATDPGNSALFCDMSREEISQNLKNALNSLPGVIGVNNHMGSAFTARKDATNAFLEEIARQNIFFLDSKTAKNDVSFQMAREMNLKTCRRGIFLDNLRDEEVIWRKLVELCWEDRPDQSRIAIGHPYPETIRVLRERLGELELMGCEVAPVQEFCK